MKKQFLTAGTIVPLFIGVLVPLNVPTHQTVSAPAPTPSVHTETKARSSVLTPNAPTPQAPTTEPTSFAGLVPAPTPNFALSVGGKSYATFSPIGSSVLDAMRSLASTSDLSFTGRDYPSLGFFVDSINGKKAESGYNWMLYVNGKLSNTGASETHLKAGDTVEWKYEKGY